MNSELKHFGVKGMKWGVITKSPNTLYKASRKMAKLDNRYDNAKRHSDRAD